MRLNRSTIQLFPPTQEKSLCNFAGYLSRFGPQALDVAVADRDDAGRRTPSAPAPDAEEGIFVGPPRRVLRRDGLEISRRGAVQGAPRERTRVASMTTQATES
jgi:hypothetical protein